MLSTFNRKEGHVMRNRAPNAGRAEMEGLEIEGERDRSAFHLKIGLTPSSPSQARKQKRELGTS